MKSKIYAILGPSGTGKSELVNYVKDKLDIEELTSHTTRDKREGDVDGDPYYFVSDAEFHEVSYIEKVVYDGNFYGLSMKEVDEKLNNNDAVVVIIDREGIEQLKCIYSDIVRVVYVYSTYEECLERMVESRKEISAYKRMINSTINNEHENHDIADFIIRNKDLKTAKKQMVQIIGRGW